MGYSARRGFTNGKVSGAQRQAELQQKIAEVQEQMNAAQESSRRPWTRRMWRCCRIWWCPLLTRRCGRPARLWIRA